MSSVRASALLYLATAAATGLAALTIVACGGDDGPPPDASPACAEAELHSDLEWIQDNVLTPSCANFSACHQGAAGQAGGLNLEAGRSRAALVGVASTRFTDWTLVVPNNPAMSYLMVVLGHVPGPIDDRIGLMPFNSRPLCREKLEAIERWIVAGAPDTPTSAAPVGQPADGSGTVR